VSTIWGPPDVEEALAVRRERWSIAIDIRHGDRWQQ
jgi:hypothetical protein